MKILLRILTILAITAVSACIETSDTTKAEHLNDKVSAGTELSQSDYSDMIEQYGAALDYLVAATDSVMLEHDPETRTSLGRALRRRPLYQDMQRVWSDFGSVLFQARAHDRLDAENLNAYMELAPYADRYARNMAALKP